MLYRLEIENFFSIRDPQVLDLTIDAKVPDFDGRYAPIFKDAAGRAPKVVALYGANASGKTTVLRALQFVIAMIRDSVEQTGPGFPAERFNDEECANRSMRLAFEMGGPMNITSELQARIHRGEVVEEGTYRYELAIDVRDGVLLRIRSEALRQRPNGQGKWQRVFERDADGQVKDSRSFSLSGYQHLLKTLAAHHSVLSSFAKFQHPTARIFVEMARKVLFQIGPTPVGGDQQLFQYLQSQPDMMLRLNDELGRIDVGVEGMRWQEAPTGPVLMFKHRGLHVEMPWVLESHGTQVFIKLFPLLAHALAFGGMVVIDEMDTAIHPLVLPELIRWFYDPKRNPHGAQLWLSCHSAALLDTLNKEEIVLCEKDRQGRTSVYSLMDVKVRRDENHYRKYLSGAYGGVPHLA